jgi:methylase of polypeptide subunit release factors
VSSALARLRERLRLTGYDEAGIEALVRDEGRLGFGDGLAALRLRPEADEPLSVLVRLFLGGEQLPRTLVTSALAPVGVEELGRAGLLGARDGLVRARLLLEPLQELVVASDRPSTRPRADHVVRIGPATRTLAALTVRRQVETTLDLGAGSGVQAFLAARHSERVLGVDLNRRALRLARLNAELNGVENVEWRQGDLYAPVGGERFDLVAANPPFVVSPAHALTFRDGGLGGDELSRTAVLGAAQHLREGGFASVLCSWVTTSGPRRWLEGSGCDAWVLVLTTDSPVTYAIRWNSGPGLRSVAVAEAAEPWLADYVARGIEAISTGIVVLRRRDGASWIRFDELSHGPRGEAGGHVERVFAAQDYLSSLDDESELLAAPLALAPGALLVERRRSGGALERARVTVEEGIPLPGSVPVSLAPVLATLDGRRPLSDLLAPGAQGEALPVLRELVARGLLVATGER